MALPTFRTGQGATAGTAALTKAWPASPTTYAADDVAILIVQSSAQAISLSDAQGFVEFGTQQTIGTAGAAGSTRIATFWCRATSGSMPSPTVADSGDHQTAMMIVFRGCKKTETPVVAGSGTTGTGTSISVPGGTTTIPDCLIVAAVADGWDNASTTRYTSWADSQLASITERGDAGTTTNNGGGIGLAHGDLATPGTYGPVTVTLANSSNWAGVTFALLPEYRGGQGANTLDSVTAAGTGSVTDRGIGSVTLDDVSVASAGSVTDRGIGATTLDDVTAAGAGSVADRGAGSIALDDVTATGEGTVAGGGGFTGGGSNTLDDVVASGAGTAEQGDPDPEPEPGDAAATAHDDGVFPIIAVELLHGFLVTTALSHAPALACALSHGHVVAATTEHAGVLSITVRHTDLEGLMADTYVTTTRVRVFASFTNLAGRAFDPKVLDVTVKTPSGRLTYRQGRDAQIGRTAIGSYYVDVLANAPGDYRVLLASTAAGEERALVDEFSAITAEQALTS